uniref:Bromodomain associated domain-containing protein n=2 Tax=Kalanchoe fedtschenkoi TaxID=63787 RepID=A0A7N0TJH3_KALFE
MALLGDDGRGFELARKLESCGVWRSWLGDALYPHFAPFLSSPAAWESFMKSDESKSRAHVQLQLRARALLFDKASVSLFLRSPPRPAVASSAAVSKLSPAYLQLHGDDVYFTLESTSQEGGMQREGVGSSSMSSKAQMRPASNVGSRYSEPEFENRSQRFRHEEFPESWYSQFFEKYKASRAYTLSGDRESDKRTPEEMSSYMRLAQNQKKRRFPFLDYQSNDGVSTTTYMHSVDEDAPLFPEIMFTLNSVPDTALPMLARPEDNQKFEFKGVLDTLPHVMTRSSLMIERLGIRPEYINSEQGGYQYHGRSGFEGKKTSLSQEQALQISQRLVVSMLRNTGFESATQLPIEIISQLLSCHIVKLGGILKVLADNYRKQCSAVELIKMFLQSTKHSNLGPLMELVKEGTRVVQQTPSLQGMHPQFQQHHNPLRQAQQIPRAIHPHMQQLQSQTIAFQHQQQWDRMRRRQAPNPRPGADQLVQVKLENTSDLPIDGNMLTAMNNRNNPRMQFRQQQLAAMSNFQAQQANNQFRQMASLPLQAPPQQVQSPNMGISRAPPVKVEGFQELMGGDASSKHDSDSNKLMSPPPK